MMVVAPRIVSDVLHVTDINYENLFSWQAQSLVILECYVSKQAQYLVMSERSDMTSLCSDHGRIGRALALTF